MRRIAGLMLAAGLALIGLAVLALIPGRGSPSETPRSMMGSGFVNGWADVGPGTFAWSDWLALRLDDPAGTAVVIWNHGTTAMKTAPSCLGTDYFPPPPIIRLERLPGLRIYYLCTGADQANGPRAYFEGRRDEILALAARFRAAGLAPERLFLAGQSGGAAAAALALAAEPESFGGGILLAPAWRGRGEGFLRGLRDTPHDRWLSETLVAADRLDALVVAYEADAWNQPADLRFLSAAHPDTLTLVSPGCGADHGGAYWGCGVEPTARAAEDWMRARLGR